VTKEEVIAAILKCAEQLGHTPSRPELAKYAGLTRHNIEIHFRTLKHALEACNLEIFGCGRRVEIDSLFRDWAGIVRKLKKIPTNDEYEEHSKYSLQPLRARFGGWPHVPSGMKRYAEEAGLTGEWADVLEVIDRQAQRKAASPLMSPPAIQANALLDRPMYGPVIGTGPMICGPTNEQGVLFLFGALAEQLGFRILRIQTGFPDCEAWRVVGNDRLQRVGIELELESRNFLRHGHDVKGCDLIVCWEHDWEECPIEVVELRKVIGTSGNRKIGKSP